MERLLSVREVCERLGISRALLFKLWQQHNGPRHLKIGHRTLVREADLDQWIVDRATV